jgi:hypothetical protein
VSQPELLKKTVQALDSVGIDYMVTGSIVSSLQGAPRSTHDIDVVVDLHTNQVGPLISKFPAPEYYMSETAIAEAMKFGRMFNLLEVSTGQKVDFWVFKDEPFNQSRFTRRLWTKYADVPIRVSSPEDTILSKLVWDQLSGGTEKQFTDALRVYEVQRNKLDMAYLQDWAVRLEVQPSWERLQSAAMPEE